MTTYAILALLAAFTLDGGMIRNAVWILMAGLAAKTYIAYRAGGGLLLSLALALEDREAPFRDHDREFAVEAQAMLVADAVEANYGAWSGIPRLPVPAGRIFDARVFELDL